MHLTFARRAHELAAWYRARGSKVALGGWPNALHAREFQPVVGFALALRAGFDGFRDPFLFVLPRMEVRGH